MVSCVGDDTRTRHTLSPTLNSDINALSDNLFSSPKTRSPHALSDVVAMFSVHPGGRGFGVIVLSYVIHHENMVYHIF